MISVIVPVYNEERYIRQLLDFFLAAKPADKEIILVDGGSADSTVQIINEYQLQNPQIHLLYNSDKYVPFALNIALDKAIGDYIIRLDAHCKYAIDYFEKIVETFHRTGADIVGGPTRTACTNSFQCAVGYAISTPFGVGDSKVHDENYEGYVDSVTFGAWKKEVFADVGRFDTHLLRNQDDEFSYRAKSKGKKLYLDPKIKLWYYPRSTAKGVFRQYYQYGIFKPLVLRKVRSEVKVRHLIPAAFVIYLFSLPIAFIFWLWALPLLIYIMTALYFARKSKQDLQTMTYIVVVYPLIHVAYGLGFLRGFLLGSKI